ncbi:beta-1,4-galactosyltransferase galt-1 [Aplysia californica]|uniref:Glycosyltransferase family 92 protein n=1 Tax=Aplysia californica TaxID=6500 RepID=A0ABM1VXJ8_APLCA|nr:beta-1,4-galactosyltransferase galt-1 [Aplysia californica]XP_035827142.1 beta-1,4-galactosyltransferase galt-1 [Aplysia californica]
MWLCTWLRRCVCRKLFSLILITYIAMIFLLLGHIGLDPEKKQQQQRKPEQTADSATSWQQGLGHFQSLTEHRPNPRAFSESVRRGGTNSGFNSALIVPSEVSEGSRGHDEIVYGDSLKYEAFKGQGEIVYEDSLKYKGIKSQGEIVYGDSLKNIMDHEAAGYIFLQREKKKLMSFLQPAPIPEPMVNIELSKSDPGDFIEIGRESYVYSAYLDDRKEQTYIRIMTLMSKSVSSLFIFCHFQDVLVKSPRVTERYEMCENHNKKYGGFIFSCRVPDFLDFSNKTNIVISLTKYGPQLKIPLFGIRPPKHKLKYLDLQATSIPPSTYSFRSKQAVPSNKNIKTLHVNNSAMPSSQKNFWNIPLSFAICVPPLFGDISVYRFIEFMELSRLLGADHVFFYNYSIPPDLSDALVYYTRKNMATVLPWKLPADVTSGKVWYQGQLLAHNDCLYRAIPRYDLVSFNDLDEFIVPHTNSTTWQEVFGPLLTDNMCGYSFQSAFYEPGVSGVGDEKLMTPVLTARTSLFSKVL